MSVFLNTQATIISSRTKQNGFLNDREVSVESSFSRRRGMPPFPLGEIIFGVGGIAFWDGMRRASPIAARSGRNMMIVGTVITILTKSL